MATKKRKGDNSLFSHEILVLVVDQQFSRTEINSQPLSFFLKSDLKITSQFTIPSLSLRHIDDNPAKKKSSELQLSDDEDEDNKSTKGFEDYTQNQLLSALQENELCIANSEIPIILYGCSYQTRQGHLSYSDVSMASPGGSKNVDKFLTDAVTHIKVKEDCSNIHRHYLIFVKEGFKEPESIPETQTRKLEKECHADISDETGTIKKGCGKSNSSFTITVLFDTIISENKVFGKSSSASTTKVSMKYDVTNESSDPILLSKEDIFNFTLAGSRLEPGIRDFDSDNDDLFLVDSSIGAVALPNNKSSTKKNYFVQRDEEAIDDLFQIKILNEDSETFQVKISTGKSSVDSIIKYNKPHKAVLYLLHRFSHQKDCKGGSSIEVGLRQRIEGLFASSKITLKNLLVMIILGE